MFEKSQLDTQSTENLQAIAKQVGVNKYRSMDKTNLVYGIIDRLALHPNLFSEAKSLLHTPVQNADTTPPSGSQTSHKEEPTRKVTTNTDSETSGREQAQATRKVTPANTHSETSRKNTERIKTRPVNRNPKRRNPTGKESNDRSAPVQPPLTEEEEAIMNTLVVAQGVFDDSKTEGYGFLRSAEYNYFPSPDDIYVSQSQMRKFRLKTGDIVEGKIRLPRGNEKYYPMVEVLKINGLDPGDTKERVSFGNLTPIFPEEKFNLFGKEASVSTKIIDIFSPIGKGQRGLIVAQPKTGKTQLLKDIANVIAVNHPEVYQVVLLIDERPEEVTDMRRNVKGEVVASTFDESAEKHVKLANIVLEKAKRMVESGHDVIILLDSITRLARAYNMVSPTSGKILSGGVDANALHKPKRFFGAARNVENGGSLTIVATALTDTGSKMDDVIFEEFKGTGNMEMQLDRRISNRRIFPAIDLIGSGTRRDDLLLDPKTSQRMWLLRKTLSPMNPLEAIESVIKVVDRSDSVASFFERSNQ